jgi:hypothetical protein
MHARALRRDVETGRARTLSPPYYAPMMRMTSKMILTLRFGPQIEPVGAHRAERQGAVPRRRGARYRRCKQRGSLGAEELLGLHRR